jgi:hypothetical protein
MFKYSHIVGHITFTSHPFTSIQRLKLILHKKKIENGSHVWYKTHEGDVPETEPMLNSYTVLLNATYFFLV